MNILYSIPAYHPAYGGPFFSVGALAAAMAKRGHRVGLVASDYRDLPVQTPPEGVELFPLKAFRVPGLRCSINPKGEERLREIMQSFHPDLLHDNGLWLKQNQLMARCAREQKIPLVHSPRGCLDPWALNYRKRKKDLAWMLYQRRNLNAVRCFHAASELEEESIRRKRRNAVISVIPNGIELPQAVGRGRSAVGGDVSADQYALFLGRLDPVKNLPSLIRAWAKVRPEKWKLVLMGEDVLGHRKELETLTAELDLTEAVCFQDPVYGGEKWDWIQNASLGCLVSHSENFGLSAAETLACGVPVITSKGTPWKSLAEIGAGWWVEGTPFSIAGALKSAVSMTEEERGRMGQKGREFVQQTFGWDRVSEAFEEMYDML